MSSILPTAREISNQIDDYLTETEAVVKDCVATVRASATFREIYRISSSTNVVLGALSMSKLRPTLSPARSLVVRVPLIVGVGQVSVAEGQLRRFVELIAWTVYFTDHPVEWAHFKKAQERGFSQDPRKPIAHAAHRELKFYLHYARELMGGDPSRLGIKAVEQIEDAVETFNSAVHAGELAKLGQKTPPHDNLDENTLRKFATTERRAFANCVILLSAYQRLRFNRFNAVERSSFDWLVGPRLRRDVRSGPFGIT